ncbi:receptor-type tyrosine-protein phosphatase F-like isoform X2 [Homarus americanus]|uniref:receptor-type tyrosine-protein phosphatase F-like isoform X2 n=1 Tax=Homarus americanus TaxID=6706 RepID=UPI001C451B7E|nr:receptor-type tyrosine-protein phosphatase F-like isoform X2 [Homarus americanus]
MLCWSRVLLLLYVLLLAAATEDSEEQQKENEGFASLTYGEGPPLNVIVEAVSSTALNVSWDPPDEEPQYYEVTDVRDSFNELAYTTYCLIDELQPCKTYFYTVASHYESKQYPSPPTSGITLASVPPPPLNCDFDRITTNSMYLTWSAPDTACHIRNYNISWSWSSLWDDEHDSGETFSTVTKTPLRGLPPYANVTVDIAAATDAGFGPPLTCWNVTQQDKPGPPVNVRATTADHAVSVTWEKPQKANGKIVNYIISGSENDTTVDGKTTTVNIQGLQQCKLYNITVTAATVAGWGTATDPLPVFLNDSVIPSSVKCDLNGSNVMVTWVPPPEQCPPPTYNISWSGTSLWSDDTDTNSCSMDWMNEDPLSYELPHSLPYTKYSVCVSVDGYTSDTGCCQRVTPQATPGPPELLNLHNDKTSLIVNWTEPEEKNGVIDEYRITWTDSKGTPTNTKIPKESCCSHTINNLTPCENYTVSVSAHTVDWGEESPTKKTFIPNFVTDSSLNCDGSNSREAHISWSLAVRDCPVDEYFMNWTTTVQWNGHHNSNSTTMKGGGNLTTVLRGLEPETEFDFCLRVDEAGSNTACCTSTTRPEKPSQPKNLKIENKTQTTVTLSWSLPDQLNGILEDWQLTWPPNTEDEGIVLPKSKRAYTVTNLKPSTNYTFDLMAGNGAGYGDAAEIIVTTKPPDNNNNTNNTAIIIGASVGGVLLVVILVASSVYVYRNKSRKTPPISRKDTPLERSQNIYSQYPDPYVNQQQTPGNKESLSHEQGPREDIALDEINIKRPNSSMFTEEMTPARNNAGERRPSQTPSGVINYSGPRRPSQAPDEGINYKGPRRPSQAPYEGINYKGPRRPSQAPDEGINYKGPRRPSQAPDEGINYKGPRRPSQAPDEGINYKGPRRPSQAPDEGINYKGPRRPSQAPDEGINYKGPRRPSQAPDEGINYKGPRRPSQAPDEGINYKGPRRPSQAPDEGINYKGPRRPSQAPDEGINYKGPRRTSQAPDEGINYNGPRRPSQAPDEGINYKGPRRPSQAPDEGINYKGPRRPSQAPYEGINYNGPRRPSQAPDEGINYNGPRRPSQAPYEGINYNGPRRPSQAPNEGINYNGSRRPSQAPDEGINYNGPRRPSEVINSRSGGQNYNAQRRLSEKYEHYSWTKRYTKDTRDN